MLIYFVLLSLLLPSEAALCGPNLKKQIRFDDHEFEITNRRGTPTSSITSSTTISSQTSSRSNTPSSPSSKRVYTPSPPIKIPHTEESSKRAEREWRARTTKLEEEYLYPYDTNLNSEYGSSFYSRTPDLFMLSYAPEQLKKMEEEREEANEKGKVIEDSKIGSPKFVAESSCPFQDEEVMKNFRDLRMEEHKRKQEEIDALNDLDYDSDFGPRGKAEKC